MIAGKLRAISLLLWMPTALMADKSHVHFMINASAGNELQLEVRQSPLAQALNEIADKTGVLIHYSALPEKLISVTCAEATVAEIVKCLLDKQADFIIRYPESIPAGVSKKQPEEIWVTGTGAASDKDVSKGTITAKTQITGKQSVNEKLLPAQAAAVDSDMDEIAKLLQLTKDKDPARRADAIASLATKGTSNDSTIRKALTDALSDKNAEIRSQAVSSLARREGDKAAAELQSALQDSDSTVRLMAVDNAGENMALLQQATSDNDETVRTLAAMKLNELTKAGGRQ